LKFVLDFSPASVFLLLPDGSSEESFASVAGCGSVVFASGTVAANGTDDDGAIVPDQRLTVEHITENLK
jgi:hypothetical protein